MTSSSHPQATITNRFWVALAINAIWINVSEVWRYFMVVKPMLHEAFPDTDHIGAVTAAVFASWMVWDTILIVAATGFYWLVLTTRPNTVLNAVLAASVFTITVFGLLWLGIINMGLAPARFFMAALPLAWIEQVVAAVIVWYAMRR